jgi:putative ABC transport system permease protein
MNQNPHPPQWADRFFRWFCSDEFSEIILGDLHEMFQHNAAEEGLKKARRQFIWDVLTVIRPFALKKPFARLFEFLHFIPDMLTHYFISSFRNLRRNRTYAIINIMGLTLGILCSLIVFLKIQSEVAFDNFHEDEDRIFRIKRKTTQYGLTGEGAGVPTPMPKALREDYPQFERVTIIDGSFASSMVGIYQPDGELKTYQEKFGKMAYVDPDYFDIFHKSWLSGNAENALTEPFTVVLSESFAAKYFGEEDPMGKTINMNSQYDLRVVGVVNDPPENTGFPFEIFISTDLGKFSPDKDDWGSISSSTQCYVKLKEGESAAAIEALFPDFIKKHRGEEEVKHLTLFLQPLRDVHFDMNASTFAGGTTPKELLWTLGLIGIFLIITASINFVNLSTALVFRRSREVGVRKVLGSSRQQILLHFIGETAILTILSTIIAVALVTPALHFLEPYIGEGLSLDLLGNPGIWGMIFSLILIITFLSGLYPAMLLARLQPVMAMKNRWDKKYGQGLNLRKGLIAAQFAISQVLIIGTIVMIFQMDYFYSAPLGFDKESIVELTVPRDDVNGWTQLKNSLAQIPSIKHTAYSNSGAASGSMWMSNYSSSIGETLHEGQTHVKIVDNDYIDTYGMMMVAGDQELPGDSADRFIVNESFVRALGIQNPEEALGKNVKIWGREAPITGVVQDFHTVSLHKPIEPTIIWIGDEYSQLAIKLVAGADIPATIKDIEKAWLATFPDRSFNHKFLDEALNEFYEDEAKTLTLIQIFAIIAILIGCLGLFGLVSFMAIQRTKEIGVRKVLGASSGQIVKIFAWDFFILVILGFFVAAPIGYYVMDQWLQDFAFQINIGPMVFVVSIIASMIIALLTVGYKSYQAATANPIEALRDE